MKNECPTVTALKCTQGDYVVKTMLLFFFYLVTRDSRLMSIGAGADEVMLSIICKYMDTLPRK